ncbi:MAG: ribose 5-phosphate isomerase B [Deltaproteobacteria bacterium]|nr:ribose 5-phosphate isomerase B [Deltaproteobacteria bacterium]
MKIALATDHGGFPLKETIKKLLLELHVDTTDYGSEGAESVDYPDYAIAVAEQVSEGKVDAGVLVCGTGIGMAIVANKFKGIRAAVVNDPYTARMAKEHNNANIVCLGGRVNDPEKARELVKIWLTTRYEGGRHDRRLQKISEIDKKNLK